VSAKKHVYFDLVDSESNNPTYPTMLAITLFAREAAEVNKYLAIQGGTIELADGVRVRISGRLATYESRSSIQLRMSGIDHTFTLGVLDQERDRVLALLVAEGLLGANAARPLNPLPTRVALITSLGSAAHADVLGEFKKSSLGLEVFELDARVQGAEAEADILSALRTAQTLKVDVILLCRGGGARTDLAAFDLESIARAIAASPVPIFTGIGHEIDSTVAQEVAHSGHKTPTACAAAIVQQVRSSADLIERSWAHACDAATARVDHSERQMIDSGSRAGRAAIRHVDREQQRVTHLLHRTRIAVPRVTSSAETRIAAAASRVGRAAHQWDALTRSRLEAIAARALVHDPAAALRRGWSITRSASGTVVRSASEMSPGEVLTTQLSDGNLISTVTESTVHDTTSSSGKRGQET
ncbi:MAG: exodeoxyribonuclease VII large subunit, partial [Microthrixaceae bacterium]